MNQEKQKKFLVMVAYYGVIILGAYLGCRFLLPPLVPFLIGFLVAWILHRPVVLLSNKLHMTQKIPAVVLTAIFYFVAVIVIVLAGAQIISALKDFLPRLPEIFTNQLLPFLDSCMENIKLFVGQIDSSFAETIDIWAGDFSTSIIQMLSSLSGSVLKSLSSVAAGMPSIILKIVLTIISTFFFSLDYERITQFLKRLLPKKAEKVLHPIKEKMRHSLKVFARSYSLIFLMTFAELSIGFLIMRIPYAIWIGLIVAIVDIMPVLGTGLVLLPWAAIAALTHNIPLAIGMLLLYVIMTVVRNAVEPKLVSQQIGLHPLATLISMFLGVQLFGIVGLFVFPVVLSLLVQFNRDGILPQLSWMRQPSE